MRVRSLSRWIWSAARSGSDAVSMLAARGGGKGRGDQDKEQQETQGAGPTGRCPSVGQSARRVRDPRRRQEGSGKARNLARAPLYWVSQGQRWGRCSMRRRALRVSRPAREKSRRRRVLVVTTPSPRPMRAVQRARLWAITWTASQAALAAKRPEGSLS